MCLFVCVVDHGVNEGEPVDEQCCEPVNEDQSRNPEPEGQHLERLGSYTQYNMFYKEKVCVCGKG